MKECQQNGHKPKLKDENLTGYKKHFNPETPPVNLTRVCLVFNESQQPRSIKKRALCEHEPFFFVFYFNRYTNSTAVTNWQ